MITPKMKPIKQNSVAFVLWAGLAALLTYSCMYAFRKPFTVGQYQGIQCLGIDYKIWLISAQVIGYTLSKFIGIRLVSSIKKKQRALYILLSIMIAELALLGLSIAPAPYGVFFMFFNGLPLGIVWGLVFSYLEGRRSTEILGAILCASFIVSSGFVKSIGKYLMLHFDISETTMPFMVGIIFIIPLLIAVFALNKLPDPSEEDVQMRCKREPMTESERRAFLKEFGIGVALLVIAYMSLTFLRELRDNFAAEIWTELGYGNESAIFVKSEIPIAILTLSILALVVFVKRNHRAFNLILSFIIFGFMLLPLATVLYNNGMIDGFVWMTLTGAGLYFGYVPFNAFLFERMIAAFSVRGNIGFVMYIADSFGYLGSIAVLLIKNFSKQEMSWFQLMNNTTIIFALVGVTIILISMFYFNQLAKKKDAPLFQFS